MGFTNYVGKRGIRSKDHNMKCVRNGKVVHLDLVELYYPEKVRSCTDTESSRMERSVFGSTDLKRGLLSRKTQMKG